MLLQCIWRQKSLPTSPPLHLCCTSSVYLDTTTNRPWITSLLTSKSPHQLQSTIDLDATKLNCTWSSPYDCLMQRSTLIKPIQIHHEDEVTSLSCWISWLPRFLSFAKLVEQHWVGIWVEQWLEITWDVSTTFSFLASFGLCLKKDVPIKKKASEKSFILCWK